MLSHPDVMKTSVVSRDHSEWGEEVVAFVVLRSDSAVSNEVLDRHCCDLMARF